MPPKASRFLVWLASLAAAFLLLILGAAALVWWQPALARPLVLWALTPEGGSASLDRLEIGLSPLILVIQDLETTGPEGTSLKLARLRLVLDASNLWGRRPWLRLVEIQGLHLDLQSSPEAEAGPPDLSRLGLVMACQEARVNGATIKLATRQGLLHLEALRLAITPQAPGSRALRLACRLAWQDPSGRRLAWARLTGSGGLDDEPSLRLNLRLAQGGLALPGLKGPLSGAARLELGQDLLKVASLSLSLPAGHGRLTPSSLRLRGQAGLDGSAVRLTVEELALGSLLRVSADFEGSLHHGIRGQFKARGDAALGLVEIRGAALELNLAGSLAAPCLEHARLSLAQHGLLYRGKPLPLGKLEVSTRATLGAGGTLRLDKLRAEAEGLGSLEGALLLAGGRLQKGALQGRALNAGGVLALARAFTNRPAQGWQAEGTLQVSAELDRDRPGRWQVRASSSELGFSSPDGTVLVGQLAGELAVKGELNTEPMVEARLDLRAGQALLGTVLLDLAQSPLELNARAKVAALSTLRQVSFQGKLQGYGRLAGQGFVQLTDGALSHAGRLQVEDIDLAKVFATFVRDPLSVSHPRLASWQVRGRSALELEGRGSLDQADIQGKLVVSGAGLATDQGTLVKTLDLELPLAYRLGVPGPARPRQPERQDWGRLRLAGLNLPGLELKHLELPLALTPNRLWVRGKLEAPLAGGTLQVSGLQVDEPLSPSFRARFAVQVEDLDLARLSPPSLPLTGSLAGRLAPVILTAKRLQTQGELTGTLFGGSLTVSGLAVERPLSPGREIRTEATARGMDLEPLSQALQIGRITGRLDAEMRGLRLAYGQPVAFTLRVESQQVPGVTQEVSLKAVDSISVLGTGTGLGGMGMGLFAQVFKEFPYQKIAFSCRLQNDVFRIRGLIHEDGVEYLVKRPFLMGINVINRNPDNRISFSDMLDRLKRVRRGSTPRDDGAQAREER